MIERPYQLHKIDFYDRGEALFKTLVFEELVDVYNRTMARDDRLEATVRRINDLHHFDETRHLAFGRRVVKDMFDRHAEHWSPEKLQSIRKYLASYLAATWKEYYNPDAYRDAGLADSLTLRNQALAHPAQRAHCARIEQSAMRFLTQNGILEAGTESTRHENETRAALRAWVRDTSEKLDDTDITDDTRIFKDGILQSIHVMDLILMIEHMSERAIDVDKLETGLFSSVNTIYEEFFSGESHYHVK